LKMLYVADKRTADVPHSWASNSKCIVADCRAIGLCSWHKFADNDGRCCRQAVLPMGISSSVKYHCTAPIIKVFIIVSDEAEVDATYISKQNGKNALFTFV